MQEKTTKCPLRRMVLVDVGTNMHAPSGRITDLSVEAHRSGASHSDMATYGGLSEKSLVPGRKDLAWSPARSRGSGLRWTRQSIQRCAPCGRISWPFVVASPRTGR